MLELLQQITCFNLFNSLYGLVVSNVALIFNAYSNFLLFFQEAHIKRVCSQVFSIFPDFVQLSKDAAFETISDPKYSGKMKVTLHFRRKICY